MLGQDIIDVVVLVKVSGLDDVRLVNDNIIFIDYCGYVIVLYVMFYCCIDIMFDSIMFGEDMELLEIIKSVVLMCGVIVCVSYDGNIGQWVFVYLKIVSGQDVFYGVMVLFVGDSKLQLSIVSDVGMVYMFGLQQIGIFNVQWGKSVVQQCNVLFILLIREGKVFGIR